MNKFLLKIRNICYKIDAYRGFKIKIVGPGLFILFLLISSGIAKNRDYASPVNKNPLQFFSFGVNEGLSQGNVTCMMRDHRGMMWFGTWDGINLYDGFRNNTFSQAHYNNQGIRGVVINNIMEIDSNRIAISTYIGLSIFYRNKNRFEYYLDEEKFLNCRVLQKTGDFLVISAGSELRKFNCKTLKFSPFEGAEKDTWNAALKNRKNGTNRSEFLFSRVFPLIRQQPKVFKQISKLWTKLTVNDIHPIPGNGWFYLGCDEGLFLLDASSGRLDTVLKTVSVKSLYGFKQNLYIGTQVSGLYVLDVLTNTISANYRHSETSKRSVTGDYIRNIYVDKTDRIWLSVLGGGINFCNLKKKRAKTLFSYSDLPIGSNQDNYIQALAEDSSGKLCMYTVAGKLKILDSAYHILQTYEPSDIDKILKPVSVQQIFVSSTGKIFLLSNKGLYSKKGNGLFSRAICADSGDGASYLQYMIETKPGKFLVGSRKGLFLFDEVSNTLFRVSNATLDKEVIHFLFQDKKGYIYVNRFFKGVSIFEWHGNSLKQTGFINTQANLKSGFETKDELLFASTKGIVSLDPKLKKITISNAFSGLPNQTLYSLLPDPDIPNAFWCSSNRGVFGFQFKTGKYVNLGIQDGLSSLEFNTNAFAKRKNGDFVFGSIDGLSIFSPAGIIGAKTSAQLILDDFKIQQIPDSALAQYKNAGSGSYQLPYENNGFSCRLIQVDFPNFETPIRYKLLGHEKQWNKGINPLEIRYSNLPEGDYELITEFYNPQKGWITNTWFKLSIDAPWFRTWWAYSLFGVLLLSLIGLVTRIYINKKLQIEREEIVKKEILLQERTRVISDLHDDVGSSLSSIQVFSQVAEKLMDSNPEKTRQFLHQIRQNSQTTINNLSDIVWAMKPDHALDSLESRIRSFCHDLLQAKDIAVEFHFESPMLEIFNDAEKRKNILLLVKEAVHNVSKYSKANLVVITFRKIQNGFELKISDNGIGFDSSNQKQGNGTETMKNRAESLGGVLKIESIIGNGTVIQLLC